MNYQAAVITISDKGSKGERVDTSGPACQEILAENGWEIVYTNMIPDEKADIEKELKHCADEEPVSLVITTGGTGFSPRDVTPEATEAVCDRMTPGIAEAMRASSMQVTDRAMLSRATAGLRGATLIINLPGSEKAARENLTAVVGALKHGIEMVAGGGHEAGENGSR